MAYTTPLKVFQSMQRIDRANESFDNTGNGDTVQLSNFYIVKDTETVELDGSTVADTDYSVDLEDNTVTYTGTGSGTLTVDYRYAPYDSATVQDRIDGVEAYIDDYTNTTFDGLTTVSDELYDSPGRRELVYSFVNRPVRNVSSVAVNDPETGNNPNYVSQSEGLDGDYLEHKELGIRFVSRDAAPEKGFEKVQVTYDYGFSNVPGDIESAASEMVVDDLVRGTVSGAMVDGRDNFDPQTVDVNVQSYREVLDRYRIERLGSRVSLAEHGTEQ